VLPWDNAAALSAPVAPSAVISAGQSPKRAEPSSTGQLYLLTTSDISVYANPTTTPTLVTAVTGGGALSAFEALVPAE